MRLAVSLDYARDPVPQIAQMADLESAGVDLVLVPEVYGFDAATTAGYLAARTTTARVGFGVLPVHTRSPALIAQTAAGLDSLTGGRAVLGLGTSGPGVVTGFHGVPFTAPLARIREVVATCRAVWRRDPPPGSALRPILAPPRERIPVHLATLRPGGVALAAEIAEGWYPLFLVPERVEEVWGHALREGAARRDPSLGTMEIVASMHVGVGDAEARDAACAAARRDIALYVGGMGPRGGNFYNELAARFGWPGAAARIQDLYLAGRRREAEAAIPADMLEALTVIGPDAAAGERMARLRAAGVTTLVVRGPAAADPHALAKIRNLLETLGRGHP
ncbi:MAG: LLM class F420-dependent oxidoreductase [Thermoleophilia bacterium]